jgi:hypothetical protein
LRPVDWRNDGRSKRRPHFHINRLTRPKAILRTLQISSVIRRPYKIDRPLVVHVSEPGEAPLLDTVRIVVVVKRGGRGFFLLLEAGLAGEADGGGILGV